MHERRNIALALSVAGLKMEELGVCVTALQIAVPGLLPRAGLVPENFTNFFKIPHYIESLYTCMKH
jgi:hypothetical protein